MTLRADAALLRLQSGMREVDDRMDVAARHVRRVDRIVVKVPRHNTTKLQRSSYVRGPNMWNSLPVEIVMAPSKEIFKRCLKKFHYERYDHNGVT